jgi:hypothetical protein
MKQSLFFLAGLLVGVTVLWLTSQRYQLSTPHQAFVYRLDRWTGTVCYMAGAEWKPIKEPQK